MHTYSVYVVNIKIVTIHGYEILPPPLPNLSLPSLHVYDTTHLYCFITNSYTCTGPPYKGATRERERKREKERERLGFLYKLKFINLCWQICSHVSLGMYKIKQNGGFYISTFVKIANWQSYFLNIVILVKLTIYSLTNS